ncbi:MAG TPA: YkvA family protein [Rhizomicrobium sp.]|nr:YkvA family protein [Rhizomicrobium sp.]
MTNETPNPAAVQLPATIARNERIVDRGFWKKLLKVAGKIPFAEDAAAAYFCAVDPNTPSKVRAILLAALAYFVLPIDAIPDFVAGIGFTDDAAVMALAIAMVSGNIKDVHRRRARAALHIPEPAPEH